ERLPGVEAVVGVPPDASRTARRVVPSRDADELLCELGGVEEGLVPRVRVGVEEGEPEPAVVVEPGRLAGLALARLGPEPRNRLQVGIEVAESSVGHEVDRAEVPRTGPGGGDPVDGLEQRHYSPERGDVLA